MQSAIHHDDAVVTGEIGERVIRYPVVFFRDDGSSEILLFDIADIHRARDRAWTEGKVIDYIHDREREATIANRKMTLKLLAACAMFVGTIAMILKWGNAL